MARRPRPLIAVLAICLLARLLLFVAVRPWDASVAEGTILQSDAKGYHELATTFASYHQLAQEKDGTPTRTRTPLYPMFIAFFYVMFGPVPWVVLLAQTVIDTCSCLLLFTIVAAALDAKVAWYASLFYALDPILALNSLTLMSDTLFVFFCVLALHFLWRYERGLLDSTEAPALLRDIAYAALCLGLATLVRPVGLFVILLVAIIILLSKRTRLQRAAMHVTVLVVVFMLTLSPWLIRNLVTFGSASISTSPSYNLLVLNVLPMELERRQEAGYVTLRTRLLSEADSLMAHDGKRPEEANDFEKAVYWQKLAIQYIVRHPLLFGKHYGLGIVHTFFNLESAKYATMLGVKTSAGEGKSFNIKAYPNIVDLVIQFFRQKTSGEIVIGVLIACYLMISYFCLAVGVLVARKSDKKLFLVTCLLMAGYFVLVTGTAGLARFKMPAIPFYLPFVGTGTAYLVARFRKRDPAYAILSQRKA